MNHEPEHYGAEEYNDNASCRLGTVDSRYMHHGGQYDEHNCLNTAGAAQGNYFPPSGYPRFGSRGHFPPPGSYMSSQQYRNYSYESKIPPCQMPQERTINPRYSTRQVPTQAQPSHNDRTSYIQGPSPRYGPSPNEKGSTTYGNRNHQDTPNPRTYHDDAPRHSTKPDPKELGLSTPKKRSHKKKAPHDS
ncbi:hypothetical protein CC80DRAFT_550033 [Byssothecium circinans]|uniref:Uncharacterized protein n=1 Tax=Byssothecium circinans TaxID=147558 RepID=A0A6A5TSZ6_9PLEO|nr:hypothetical protein CC80DRAFT_550033 [Byssothecium circinans]